jgi:HAD superfamily hydrolase (TIGR01509 family)
VTPDVAVGFDFDHTLGIDNKLERTTALAMLAAAARRASYDGEAAEAAIDAVLAAYRSGAQSVEGAIAGFLERFAPPGTAILDIAGGFRDAVLARAEAHVRPLPGALELLAHLEERAIPYALLTNGWSPLQEEKARFIGFRGPVFVSERIGACKPSPAAFALLVKHFGLPRERVWYVGDEPEADCAGARAAGLRAVWFDWEHKTYPDGLARPDAVIHALGDLPALLAAASAATSGPP